MTIPARFHDYARLEATLAKLDEHRDEIGVILVLDHQSDVFSDSYRDAVHWKKRAFTDDSTRTHVLGFRDGVGVHTTVFATELAFLRAAANGDLHAIPRARKIVFNFGHAGCGLGQRAMVPAVCRYINVAYANSDPYACAIAWHKFHQEAILSRAGVRMPRTWAFDADDGWLEGRRPPVGLKVIAKANQEAWAVGVSDTSVFVMADGRERHLAETSRALHQPIVVQEFIEGREVCVPILDLGEPFIPALVTVLLKKGAAEGRSYVTFGDNCALGAIAYAQADDLPTRVTADICAAAANAFKSLGMRGMGRMDFRVTSEGVAYLFDISESPGLAPGAAMATGFELIGLGHSDLLGAVLAANLFRD